MPWTGPFRHPWEDGAVMYGVQPVPFIPSEPWRPYPGPTPQQSMEHKPSILDRINQASTIAELRAENAALRVEVKRLKKKSNRLLRKLRRAMLLIGREAVMAAGDALHKGGQ